ncbi:poly [ADP-ribose] polymerase 2 isoform X4 [Gopherus flavomarginatus]|uniref:poly [ADP-ribose] polymerase 2 isoform X4 n=1 Tax=Gopherus flavomarginatus TaxID=286002 RepID=UPI0021CBA3A0|nr:poly [ADP-ribose] polymerase 2 isoform X4 [Gopherus flavomarginatus]
MCVYWSMQAVWMVAEWSMWGCRAWGSQSVGPCLPSLCSPAPLVTPRMSRKRRAAEVGGAGLALELRWEWQDPGGTWHRFVPEQSEVLTQAARAGKPSVAVGSRVDLRRMVQRDGQTGQERCVAAAVQDQDSYFVWCWQGDEEGQWLPYPADTCLALERARRGDGGPSLEVTFSRTRYTLDTAQMTQTNVRTGYQRRMERRESDAVDDDGGSEPSFVPGSSSPQRPPAPKRRQDVGASPNPRAGGESTEAIKTLIVKGKAPVDPECLAKLGKAHVYCEGDDVYDVMLNQTNLQFNNNKFYVLQLLEDDGPRSYSVWTRWGRVGRPGQHALVSCAGDLTQAKEVFTKKFLDKTKNHWAERGNFQKVPGKYDLLHMDSRPPAAELSCTGAPQPKPASRLDPRVQALLGLICDLQAMEEMVLEMKYDTKKAPLGKLTVEQIRAGFGGALGGVRGPWGVPGTVGSDLLPPGKLTVEQIRAGFQSLQKVEAVLRAGDTGRALLEACNEFYTRVPHDFGPWARSRSPSSWRAWSCTARSTRWTGATACWAVLERYLLSTHAPTHRDYSMELLEAFTLHRAGEPPFHTSLPNRMLLWHGSRLGNWVGILSHGLQVAPPEAPVTGYMFGKGIYFADMSSKSANYCFASRQRNVGLLLLCEVALGECQELLEANAEAGELPPGKHSTKGLGKLAPVPSNSIMLDGAAVPLGPAVETGVTNPHGYTLNYNEFVVYDPGQVRMRYLLQVRFNFTPLW